MTTIIVAVGMRITRLAALMTTAYHFITYSLSQPVVEHKIFPFEFIRKIFIFHFVGVLNYPAFKMKHIFKTVVKHVSAGLFTTNSTGTVHDNILVFPFFQHVHSHWQLLTESIRWDFNSVFKMANFIFV